MLSDGARAFEFTHFHLFCGLGGGARGFNRARAEVAHLKGSMRCIGGIDSDAAAIRDFDRASGVRGSVMDLFSRDQYVAFHGKEPPPDWREAGPDAIRRAAGGEFPNVVFLSAPCLPADGKVLTAAGPREISTIRAGDKVFTHRGRLRRVTHVGTHLYTGTMFGFRLNGTVDHQWFTDEHPLWVRKVVRRGDGKKRGLGDPEFTPAKAVRVGDRVGFPVERGRPGAAREFVGSFGNPQIIEKGGVSDGRYAKSAHTAVVERIRDLREFAADENLWWLLGAYLGDGYRRKSDGYTIAFCVGAADGVLAHSVRTVLHHLGIGFSEDATGGLSNVKIRATSRHLHMLCGAFGDGADAKHLPPEIMALEDHLVEALLDGYRSTDGSDGPRRLAPTGSMYQARWKIPSVSLQLLRDFQRLLLRTGVFASIHKCWPGGSQTIMGRQVETKPRWEMSARLDPEKRTIFEFIDDVVWVRVREIATRETDEWVWNLSVEEDDTFCAPMMATHNCKGFSGLLAETTSKTRKYQALNELTLRGVWLTMEAFRERLPELVIFENVPRIATRGRSLLDQIVAMLRHYGYAVAETKHDCGEIGGLAQSRKRFLLVARQVAKVPNYLYEPERRRLRGVGEVLERLPLPGNTAIGGPMHRMPALQWKTWVRLAFVEAGSDWRSLNKLNVTDGVLSDFGIVPEMYGGAFGVRRWDEPSATITSKRQPSSGAFSVADRRPENFSPSKDRPAYGVGGWDEPAATLTSQRAPGQGRFSVADPRVENKNSYGQLGVRDWGTPSDALSGQSTPGGGTYSVADPRMDGKPAFNNVFRIVPWDQTSPAVAGPGGPANGLAVADPRTGAPESAQHKHSYRVTPWGENAGTVTSGHSPSNGGGAVADPRPPSHLRGGALGVTAWDEESGTVIGESFPSNVAFAVADPRPPADEGYKKTKYRVTGFDEPGGAVIAASHSGNGAYAVADPRPTHGANAHTSKLSVASWNDPSKTVTGSDRVGSGALSVADPRPGRPSEELHGKFHVTPYDEAARAVIGGRENGAYVVADPRPEAWLGGKESYQTGGHYGVVPWEDPAYAVTAHGNLDNGRHSVADPRVCANEQTDPKCLSLPAADERLVAVIRALDDTWHRPFTTLELAALQSLFDIDEAFPADAQMAAEVSEARAQWFRLDGESDSAWRERIGNAVPSDAAEAIGSVMLQTLLLAMTGETFALSAVPIWVRPIAVSLEAAQHRPFNIEDFDL